MFSQSRVNVSVRLKSVGSLAAGAFDLVNCSLSVVGFVSLTLVRKCRVCGLRGCCRAVGSVRWFQRCP